MKSGRSKSEREKEKGERRKEKEKEKIVDAYQKIGKDRKTAIKRKNNACGWMIDKAIIIAIMIQVYIQPK